MRIGDRPSLNQETGNRGLSPIIRDARRKGENRQQLLEGGGQIKVPCLKVMDEYGTPIWLYESNDIISYLQDLADQQAPAAACATWQP